MSPTTAPRIPLDPNERSRDGVSAESDFDPEPAPDSDLDLDLDPRQVDAGSGSPAPAPLSVPASVGPRDLVRLFQCRICSSPLREPVGLPCGKSMCRACLPATHLRTNISYPALPNRLQGFRCPFVDCGKEHALEDCAVDVVLNKASEQVRDEMDMRKAEAVDSGVSTRILMQDPWAVAGITSLRDDDGGSRVIQGGKLIATYSLAEEGDLKYEDDVGYDMMSITTNNHADIVGDENLVTKIQEITRSEMDCQVCYALFCDPFTTSCGHTFCRSCLHRILDHSRYCPICRRQLAINPLLDTVACPSNETLVHIIDTFWSDESKLRQAAVAAENASQLEDYDFPLFSCTVAFPRMPTFLHVYEPRYRLLIRRALEGDRTFGVVLPKYSRGGDDPDFHELGTLLRIVNVQFYPDGRSLIETLGLSRFRVLRHGYLDGYAISKIERVDDVSLQEEEAMEAAEVIPQDPIPTPPIDESDSTKQQPEDDESEKSSHPDEQPGPTTAVEIEGMSTKSLMEFSTSFVTRMRTQSVPWMTERMLTIYGECPEDAAIFPWWFASMLPVRDVEKYRLLGTSSVRERLKICCAWIIEWEASRWITLINGHPGPSATAQSSE